MNLEKAKKEVNKIDWRDCDPYNAPRHFKDAMIRVIEALAEEEKPNPRKVIYCRDYDGEAWIRVSDVSATLADWTTVVKEPKNPPLKFGDLVKHTEFGLTAFYQRQIGGGFGVSVLVKSRDGDLVDWWWTKDKVIKLESGWHKKTFEELKAKLTE